MRDYGRIESAFWTKMHGVSDAGKLLAAYLKSCSHANAIGAYLLPDAYIADDLGWPMEKVTQALSELLTKGFCARFQDGRHILVRGFMSAQPPENPNVVKSMIKQFERLPSDPLCREIGNQIMAVDKAWVPEAFRKAFENSSETLSQGSSQPLFDRQQMVSEGLSKSRTLTSPNTNPEPEPQPDARGSAGVREAPAPLARVDVKSLTEVAPDWAEACGDPRWVSFKRKRVSVRDWTVYLAPCRPNGSPTTLIVPDEAHGARLQEKFGRKLAEHFGMPVTLKVEAPKTQETPQ